MKVFAFMFSFVALLSLSTSASAEPDGNGAVGNYGTCSAQLRDVNRLIGHGPVEGNGPFTIVETPKGTQYLVPNGFQGAIGCYLG